MEGAAQGGPLGAAILTHSVHPSPGRSGDHVIAVTRRLQPGRHGRDMRKRVEPTATPWPQPPRGAGLGPLAPAASARA